MGDPWKANHFVVKVGNTECVVHEITGLDVGESGTIEVTDGGTNRTTKISDGLVKFKPLTLVRYCDGSDQDDFFVNWWIEVFDYNSVAGGTGSSVRRDGSIVKREYGVDVWRISFVGAYVKNMSLGDLSVDSTDLWKRTVILEHNGLYETNLAA